MRNQTRRFVLGLIGLILFALLATACGEERYESELIDVSTVLGEMQYFDFQPPNGVRQQCGLVSLDTHNDASNVGFGRLIMPCWDYVEDPGSLESP